MERSTAVLLPVPLINREAFFHREARCAWFDESTV